MSTAISGVTTAGQLAGNTAMASAGSTMGPIAWGMLELSGHGPIRGTLLPMAFGGKRAPKFLNFDKDDYYSTTDGDFTYVMKRNVDGPGSPVARYSKQDDLWQRASHEDIDVDNGGLNNSGTDSTEIFTGWNPGSLTTKDGEYWLGGQHNRSDYFSINDLNNIMQSGDSVEYSDGMLGAKDPVNAWEQRSYTDTTGDAGGTASYFAPPNAKDDFDPYNSFLYSGEGGS